MARQGVHYVTLDDAQVMHSDSMDAIANDGSTIGELMIRGNTVMKGYLKNPQATKEAFAGGWFHTGDLGVQHADGYIEIKDRAKDIIVTGGPVVRMYQRWKLKRHCTAIRRYSKPQWLQSPMKNGVRRPVRL